jgi:proteic killer suppression protein
MWTVLETTSAQKPLDGLPDHIQRKYDAWLQIVRLQGPQGLRAIRGFHDEAPSGKRKGERSSRLSKGYRVLYKADAGTVTVTVLDVNLHDY